MTDYLYDSYLSPLDALAFDIASSPSENDQEAAAAELDLWSNAQFTFDVKPGEGIYDDEKNAHNNNNNNSNSNNNELKNASSIQDNDPITYEKLVNYLDYELPQQQRQQQQQAKPADRLMMASLTTTSPTLLPRPLAAAPPMPLAPAAPQGSRQLLPKPTMMDPLQLASLLATPLNMLNHPSTASYLAPATATPYAMPSPPAKKSRKRSTGGATTAGVKREREDDASATTATTTTPTTDEALLAEEDKRKRNTAASARFRIKKKLREQAMEQTVRDMTKKSDFLQGRVNDLELEVKWLRSLLTEKELTVKN